VALSATGWTPATDRPDPVALLEAQDATRVADLVPVRHGRMAVSAFTFYRGAAKIMAEDLKDTPTAGLDAQLCGDAHLSNFGVYGSPERTLVFDLNDFDETLPGPFEYDVKRMAASFTIAGRNNGFGKSDIRDATLTSVAAYRTAMADFAGMSTTDVWYARLSQQDIAAAIKTAAHSEDVDKKQVKTAKKDAHKVAAKARTRDSLSALSKLCELVDGKYRIVHQPPIVVPLRDIGASAGMSAAEVERTSASSSVLIAQPCRTTESCSSSDSKWSTWLARSSASEASAPKPSSSSSSAAIKKIHSSCKSRKRPRRSWRITCRRVATPKRESASFRVSGSCRQPATRSSAGRRASRRTTSCTGANYAT
jgi:hypothetical protein